MQKTEEFCVDESGWIHCPFVNAERGQRYGQTLH